MKNNNCTRYRTRFRKVVNQQKKGVITTGSNRIFDWVILTGGEYFFAPSISTLITYIADN